MGKSYTQLTEGERNQIYALLQVKKTQPEIARILGRDKGTISREIKRNTGLRGYRPKQAQRKAEERKRIPRTQKMTEPVVDHIESKLNEEWSPEQVSGTMEKEVGVQVSHETIYQYVWEDKKIGGELYKKLRLAGTKKRRKKRGSKNTRGKIPNRTDIDQRPKIVDQKKRTGDWEADLVCGAHHKGFLVTLVERKHKYTLIGHVQQKQSRAVQQEIVSLLKEYQANVHTITFDNGLEFAGHEEIAKALECACYFAKPYHSWERGLNENTNGLIRQYFPKKIDLRNVTQLDLDFIMDRLNHRPRKTLEYKTPQELFVRATKFGLAQGSLSQPILV